MLPSLWEASSSSVVMSLILLFGYTGSNTARERLSPPMLADFNALAVGAAVLENTDGADSRSKLNSFKQSRIWFQLATVCDPIFPDGQSCG